MKQSVREYDFRRAFESMRPENFSYEGQGALFEYLEQYENDVGEEIELDVIAICCDFSEYTLEEINNEYDQDFDDIEDAANYFDDRTSVIPVNDDTLILQAF